MPRLGSRRRRGSLPASQTLSFQSARKIGSISPFLAPPIPVGLRHKSGRWKERRQMTSHRVSQRLDLHMTLQEPVALKPPRGHIPAHTEPCPFLRDGTDIIPDGASVGWCTATSPKHKLVLGYVWPTEDYPWLSLYRSVVDGKIAARCVPHARVTLCPLPPISSHKTEMSWWRAAGWSLAPRASINHFRFSSRRVRFSGGRMCTGSMLARRGHFATAAFCCPQRMGQRGCQTSPCRVLSWLSSRSKLQTLAVRAPPHTPVSACSISYGAACK